MAQPTLTPREFAQKWGDIATKEKAASQEHFIDLCRMLGEPTPNEADPTGTTYAFEKAVAKAVGGEGFADVWKKDFFGWEYKGRGKDLKAAYLQLLGFREDLGNPPLLVVCDLETIEIRTNFPNLSHKLYTITVDDLAAEDPSEALAMLHNVFDAPHEFRPRIPRSHDADLSAQSPSSSPAADALGTAATPKRDWWKALESSGASHARTSVKSAATPPAPTTSTRPNRRVTRSSPAIQARAAELDRLWEAKKERTRRGRAVTERVIAEARAKARSDSVSPRSRYASDIAPTRSSPTGAGTSVPPAVKAPTPLILKASPPRPTPARPEPIAGGDGGPPCRHGMSRSNCAICRPGRFLPPIKMRR